MRNEPLPDDKLNRELEQLLYREARRLDGRRFHEWLRLFTDDVRYFMAGRSNRYPKSSKAIAILDPARYVESDVTGDNELAILDEDKTTLTARVARLDTGMAWAEDPPSRTRHVVSNVEVEPGESKAEVKSIAIFSSTQPGGNRTGFLCRRPPGRAAAGERRVEDRAPPPGA